jgi:hypothetical protein
VRFAPYRTQPLTVGQRFNCVSSRANRPPSQQILTSPLEADPHALLVVASLSHLLTREAVEVQFPERDRNQNTNGCHLDEMEFVD